jgi:hypothetical protein
VEQRGDGSAGISLCVRICALWLWLSKAATGVFVWKGDTRRGLGPFKVPRGMNGWDGMGWDGWTS